MRKRITIWLCVLSLALAGSRTLAEPAPPKVSAASAILVDSITGKILYEKDSRARREPASTTKIMTAVLALEHGSLDDVVCATRHASKTPFTSLHLKPGERLTLNHLMYGLLLRSANDSAVCVAEHVAGSEREFVRMMNEKAKKIGAKDTHFVNTHGLHHPKHYSTAYDLSLIARYAVRIPEFNEFVRTKTMRIDRSMNLQDVFLKNTARFLWKFEGADGIKTGYTRQAGRCFVGSATRDGWRLIAVSLKSKDAGEDTAALLNFGYKFYKQVSFTKANQVVTPVPVSGGVGDKVNLVAADDLAVVLRKSAPAEVKTDLDVRKVSAPVEKGKKLGTLTAYLNGEKVGMVDLLAAESVDRTLTAAVWTWTRSLFTVSTLFLAGYVTYGTAVAKAARRRRRGLASRG